MELPQPHAFGTQGRKSTHDFLSLYSPAQQDPTLTPPGGCLKTHDLLQPLERVGKNVATGDEITPPDKPLPPAPMPAAEHILPGGIGTYFVSHISYINQSHRLAKPEGVVTITAQSSSSDRNDENSNCGSYSGNGFTLWEESAGKKGRTGKENIAGNRHVIRGKLGVSLLPFYFPFESIRQAFITNFSIQCNIFGSESFWKLKVFSKTCLTEEAMQIGGVPWTTPMERPSQSSSIHNHPSTNISSLSPSRHSAQKNQSFIDMLKSAKPSQEDEDDDDGEFVIKTEPSSHHKGVLSVKVETNPDQKPNILRSKHSATEQRRRSKINDRFSMLREIIPHGDQKRDKASFLLEVIEYIQFLQEKVHKYEDSYQGWSNEPPNMTPWNCQRPTEGFTDQPQVPNGVSGPALVYAAKLDENNSSVAPNIPQNGQNILDSEIGSLDAIKEICQHPRSTKKASPITAALQPNICAPVCGSTSAAAPPSRPASDTAKAASQPLPQLWHSRLCATDCTVVCDKLKDQELTIENGTISISTIYSQGVLSTLTEALQSSGVELSQASISVQIDLGKRGNPSTLNSSTPNFKKTQVPSIDQSLARSRVASAREESTKALKRFKTSIL